MRKRSAAHRRPPGATVTSQDGLLLNVAAIDLLTDEGKQHVQFLGIRKTEDGFAVHPLNLAEGTLAVVRFKRGHLIPCGHLKVKYRDRFDAEWNDGDECLVFHPKAQEAA